MGENLPNPLATIQSNKEIKEKGVETPLASSSIKKIINYCFLLAYCPSEQLSGFWEASHPLRLQAAAENHLSEKEFFPRAVLEACRRIVSYYQSTTTPEEALVLKLYEAVQEAGNKTAALLEYQQLMQSVTRLPGRADIKNRLHRKRGCGFCAAPCFYGFYSVITNPDFSILQHVLKNEMQKPAAQQRLILTLWAFTRFHLRNTLGSEVDFITVNHLGNLTFCLYLLATAKSRYPFQEKAIFGLQQANQEMIHRRSLLSLS